MNHLLLNKTTKELLFLRGEFVKSANADHLSAIKEVQEENIRQVDAELLKRGIDMRKLRPIKPKPMIEIIKIRP